MAARRLLALTTLLFGGLALGCSDKCKSTCEDEQKCPAATAVEKAADCGKVCDNAQQAVDNANCGDQFDSFNNCESDLSNICSAPANACGTQSNALAACMVPYCLKNPTDATCALYEGSSD